jgi:hypothetical protein
MALIEASADDPRLRWSGDRTTVTVVLSKLILDSGPMLDAQGRRARFGDAWRAAMAEHGWVPTGRGGMFTRPGDRDDRGQPTIAACPPGNPHRQPE